MRWGRELVIRAAVESALVSEAMSTDPDAASSKPAHATGNVAPASPVFPERDKLKEGRRPKVLRELMRQRIRRIELDAALELFSAVAAKSRRSTGCAPECPWQGRGNFRKRGLGESKGKE